MRSDAVCITGMAWTTPLGNDLDGVWRQLLAGTSAVQPEPAGVALRGDSVATVPGLDPNAPPAERHHALAVETLIRAFAAAGLDQHASAVAVVLGTSFGADLDQPADSLHAWADAVAAAVGCAAPVTVSTACSSGSDAILVGAELVRRGAAACVAGGVDIVTLAKRIGHSALRTLSRSQLRAFDVDHDGMVPGEGAAFLVLETESAAQARGVPVLARLLGGGAANDAFGLTAPDGSGDSVVLAVTRALDAAGISARDVCVVNAHATGTSLNDAVECASLGRLFPANGPMVFATKGALGHSLGATGAIEAVATVLALRDGRAPPIHGLRRPLPELSLPFPRSHANRLATGPGRRVGASITIGFGGFNTCLLVTMDDPDEARAAAPPPIELATVRRHGMGNAGPQRGHRNSGHRNSPSLFADPVAWLVVDAVATVLEGSTTAGDETGIIVCSETATADTIRSLAAAVPSGRLSPMRFAGASPGVIAGLSCIRLRLRGPSLVLTMPPPAGRPTASLVAAGWLRDGAAGSVVLVEHEVRTGGHHIEATLLAAAVGVRGGGRAA